MPFVPRLPSPVEDFERIWRITVERGGNPYVVMFARNVVVDDAGRVVVDRRVVHMSEGQELILGTGNTVRVSPLFVWSIDAIGQEVLGLQQLLSLLALHHRQQAGSLRPDLPFSSIPAVG